MARQRWRSGQQPRQQFHGVALCGEVRAHQCTPQHLHQQQEVGAQGGPFYLEGDEDYKTKSILREHNLTLMLVLPKLKCSDLKNFSLLQPQISLIQIGQNVTGTLIKHTHGCISAPANATSSNPFLTNWIYKEAFGFLATLRIFLYSEELQAEYL